ncbi:MAG TPA: HAD family phosphatase [Bryobacteraceae bacterium]|nr:HAD family phosphatase [Bryobacteraceae bacterium]
MIRAGLLSKHRAQRSGPRAFSSISERVPRCALWDLDGTLVDSEEFHWLAWRDAMADEGVELTREEFLATFGWRNDAIIPRWLPTASPEHVIQVGDSKEERYRSLVRARGISALPGAAEWIKRLAAEDWRQAVASSAPRLNVDVVLEALGLARYFQATVSAEDVQHGKPAPDVFLAAAACLDTPPSHSIVVEDAAAGIEAARRAGMASIGISRKGAPLAATLVVPSLDELPHDAFDRLLSARL